MAPRKAAAKPRNKNKKASGPKKKRAPKKQESTRSRRAPVKKKSADDEALLERARQNLRMKYEKLRENENSEERREMQQLKLLQHFLKPHPSTSTASKDFTSAAAAADDDNKPTTSKSSPVVKNEQEVYVDDDDDDDYEGDDDDNADDNSWSNSKALDSAPLLDSSEMADSFFTPGHSGLVEMTNPEHAQTASDAVTQEEALTLLSTPLGKKLLTETRANSSNDIKSYLNRFKSSNTIKKIDISRGIRIGSDNNFKMGDSDVKFSGRMIIFNGETSFETTKGLLELIFLKQPNLSVVTQEDLQTYKKIIDLTNAYRRYYSPDLPLASSKSFKFTKVVSKLYKTTGEGLNFAHCPIEYVWFNNYDHILQRLRLLIAARQSGGTGHSAEIATIIKCLRSAGCIV
jgi:hypothetical protein